MSSYPNDKLPGRIQKERGVNYELELSRAGVNIPLLPAIAANKPQKSSNGSTWKTSSHGFLYLQSLNTDDYPFSYISIKYA